VSYNERSWLAEHVDIHQLLMMLLYHTFASGWPPTLLDKASCLHCSCWLASVVLVIERTWV